MPANHNIPHTKEAKEKISKSKQGIPLVSKRRKPKLINGVNHWLCPTCKKLLPESEFYKTKRTWNGIFSQCKKCHVAPKNKALARHRIYNAIKNGSIIRPTRCSSCGNEGSIDGHHPDYNNSLDVVWLCELCHAKEHSKG